MANSKQLHFEAGRLYQKSQLLSNEADKAKTKAETYEKAGNAIKANLETKIANRLDQEALRLEQLAVKHDNEAAELDAEAYEIEAQENRLQQTLENQITKLEQRRKLLRGEM